MSKSIIIIIIAVIRFIGEAEARRAQWRWESGARGLEARMEVLGTRI